MLRKNDEALTRIFLRTAIRPRNASRRCLVLAELTAATWRPPESAKCPQSLGVLAQILASILWLKSILFIGRATAVLQDLQGSLSSNVTLLDRVNYSHSLAR